MSKQHIKCDESQLAALLGGDEQSVEFRQSAAHLESCEPCRDRLTTLAADIETWNDVAESLREESIPRAFVEPQLGFLAPPSHPEMLGRLSRYEIECVIGSGGMGVVLKAYDSELNRPVAIKVLAPHLAHNGAARQRFAREGRAAAAVVHEHVMAIHNVESEAETPFLVMQYISGQSLQTRLDEQGPMDVKEVLRIGTQAAAGLAAAHAHGVVHRDVKPSNILLENGVERVVLSDFGLARAVDDASVTRQGTLTGTPEYMSPEQAKGEAVDHRSDLFSLGSVLYSMCTGRSPFRAGSTLSVLRRISDEEPRSIREINPEIPDWLEAIVDKLLAKDNEQRFQTAEEVCELLGQWLAHLQAPATMPRPRTPAGRRTPRSPKTDPKPLLRRRMYWIALLSVLFVAIVAAAVMFVRLGETTVRIEVDDPNVAVRFGEKEITFENDGQKIHITPSAKNQLIVKHNGAEVEKRSFEFKKGQKVVLRVSTVDGRVDVSGDEGVVWLPSRGVSQRPFPLILAATLKGHASPVYTLAFSPDGKVLATAGNDHFIKLWYVGTGAEKATLKGHTKGVRFVTFSPDGTLLASAGIDESVGLWDVATGKRKLTLKSHDGPVSGVSFSPDGATCASVGDDRTVRLWDVATGKQKGVLDRHNGAVWAVAFSPAGKTVASGSDDMQMRLWDSTSGKQIGGMKGHQGAVRALAFNSTGRVLASGSFDDTINLWKTADAKKTPGLSPLATLKGHTEPVVSLSFSPDDKTLASGSWDGTIKLWNVATRKEKASIKPHSNFVWAVSFSPDGKFLASASRDKTVKLWRFPTDETIASSKERDAAIAQIEKLGGRVAFDEQNPNEPARVWFSGDNLNDDALKHFAGLTSLRELQLIPKRR